MSEPQIATVARVTTTRACPHPEMVGKRWGDAISEDRQRELQGYLDAWAQETDHGERKGPFDNGSRPRGTALTGADVFWLAEYTRDKYGGLDDLHLEGATLRYAHLEWADLRTAHLEHANLGGAHLDGANFTLAHLEGASLFMTRLQGATLHSAHLEGASLFGAWLDSDTVLRFARLDENTRLGDIQWGGVGAVNLTQINWDLIPRVGDEHRARDPDITDTISRKQRPKTSNERLEYYYRAVRAYRQLSAQLRAQGIAEVADRFAFRGQIMQRKVLRLRHQYLRYLGSLFLDLVSGYGYRPMRSVATYVLVILAFAGAYLALAPSANLTLTPAGAVVTSMVSFHGRGFFPGQPDVDGGFMRFVAAEALCGLLIEITFIATFTQRFFAR